MLESYSYGLCFDAAIPYNAIAAILPIIQLFQAFWGWRTYIFVVIFVLYFSFQAEVFTDVVTLVMKYDDQLLFAGKILLGALCVAILMLVFTSMNLVVHFIGSFFFNRYSSIVRTKDIPKKDRDRVLSPDGKITPSICFMGGGHLWSYALGIGHYLYQHYDVSDVKFLASSCGMFGAVPLVLGLDPYDWCKSDWQKTLDHFQSRHWLLSYFKLDSLYDSKHFYYQLWDDYLPKDAHIRCSGRLFLSVTLYPSLENRMISEFETRDQLIWSILSSMCLPVGFIGDFPVDIPGHGPAIDGGFSCDAPVLDSYTITASALHNASDISLKHVDDDVLGEDFLKNPLTFMDIIRTPGFDRVWQVAEAGEKACAACPDFNRQEWKSRELSSTPVHRSRSRSRSTSTSTSRGDRNTKRSRGSSSKRKKASKK